LRNIASLCRIYDEGHPYIAFSLASEIHKLLTASSAMNAVRGDKLFPTVDLTYSDLNILPEHRLIKALVYRDHVEFHPALDGAKGPKSLKFRDWWNRDIIYRAGASKNPMAVVHPVRESEQVPRNKRRTLTRRIFVELVRNKLRAHVDNDLPETLDALQRANAMGINVSVDLGDRMLNSIDGTLPMTIGPAAAMIRQISYELLSTFK